jgi:hypothetical protein
MDRGRCRVEAVGTDAPNGSEAGRVRVPRVVEIPVGVADQSQISELLRPSERIAYSKFGRVVAARAASPSSRKSTAAIAITGVNAMSSQTRPTHSTVRSCLLLPQRRKQLETTADSRER